MECMFGIVRDALKNNKNVCLLIFFLYFNIQYVSIDVYSSDKISSNQPNIVFFLIDDLGWTDINCRDEKSGLPSIGGEFDSTYYKTPNIAQLRTMGMRFTDAYVYPFCTPSRAALMTGKYPARLKMTGLTNWSLTRLGAQSRNQINPKIGQTNDCLISGFNHRQLSLKEKTVAEYLKQNNYTTCLIGKWHLAPERGIVNRYTYYPDKQGFDFNIGGFWNNIGNFWKYGYENVRSPGKRKRGWAYRDIINFESKDVIREYPIWKDYIDRNYDRIFNSSDINKGNDKFIYTGHYNNPKGVKANYTLDSTYVTDVITQRALEFIDIQCSSKVKKPFFLYVSHYAVHSVIDSKEDMRAEFDTPDKRGIHTSPEYASMIRSVDFGVGRIVKYLEMKGILDNTVIVFLSDNGGYEGSNQSSSGFIAKVTENYPLKNGKGDNDNGGMRVPMIIYCPGITDNAEDCNQLVSSKSVHAVDIMPTILDFAGVEMPSNLDGISLKPILEKSSKSPSRVSLVEERPIFCSTPNTLKLYTVGGRVIYPAASVRENGYMLFKRYNGNSYSWPEDFDVDINEVSNEISDIKKMQLKYEPENGLEYELYCDKPRYSWEVGFNNTGQAISLASGSFIMASGFNGMPGSSAKTISVWVKTDRQTSQAIIGWREKGYVSGLYVNEYGKVVQTGSGGSVVSSLAINDGKWHNVIYIYAGQGSLKDCSLYIDGQCDKDVSFDDTKLKAEGLNDGCIGAFYGLRECKYFSGLIDDLRLYSCSLSKSEIDNIAKTIPDEDSSELHLASEELPGEGISGNSKLYAWWDMDNEYGEIVPDKSDSGFHGSVVADISHLNNLYTNEVNSKYYNIAKRLKDKLLAWQISADAEMPRPVVVNKELNKAYSSINSAIMDAKSGNTLYICPGVHEFADSDNLPAKNIKDLDGLSPELIITKNITLQSIDPFDPNIISSTILSSFGESVIEISKSGIELNLIGLTLSSNDSNNKFILKGHSTKGKIENCVMRNSSGVAVYNFGGIMRNCLIADNAKEAFKDCDGIVIDDCTIVNNGNLEGRTKYYAFKNCSSVAMKNCIIWGNNHAIGSQIYPLNSLSSVSNCCIQNYSKDKRNVICLDPLFVSQNDFDYNLQSDSPCISHKRFGSQDIGIEAGPLKKLNNIGAPIFVLDAGGR